MSRKGYVFEPNGTWSFYSDSGELLVRNCRTRIDAEETLRLVAASRVLQAYEQLGLRVDIYE
jgi:hypothetical protein